MNIKTLLHLEPWSQVDHIFTPTASAANFLPNLELAKCFLQEKSSTL